jgi:asparagine synthase (glutamine-hydrolysing)
MCGIAGAISGAREIAPWVPRVHAMTAALQHRGPDSAGFIDADHVAIGVRRLAIIDLDTGEQPHWNEDRTIAAVANCEIYNYVELREQLIAKGHRFRSASDAEVIVHLYEEQGIDCLRPLRGMFAIALWDANRRRLFLARDRMGEKPLYLFRSGDTLLFASELKGLLRSGAVPFELDREAVNAFLHYSFVPEPASWMTVTIDPWRVEEGRYWSMEDAPPLTGDAPALIRSRLDDIAHIVTRSNVPVGIALSGGLDSSCIAALIARDSGTDFRCISVGYPGRPPSDESRLAEDFARDLRLPYTRVEVASEDVVASFPRLAVMRDDPIADIAGPSYAAVAKAAGEMGIKVLMQGQGADELFWGYPWVADAVRRTEGRGAATHVLSALGLRRERALVSYELTPQFRAARRILPRLLAQPVALPRAELPADAPIALTRLICDTYLRCNGIAQADRLSMAYSVEPRNPFLDHQLVDTVIGLRKSYRDVDLAPKAWLKEAVADLLPPAILHRAKRGFQPPDDWRPRLIHEYGHLLRDGELATSQLFDNARLHRFAAPGRSLTPLAFPLITLELWSRQLRPYCA